MGGQRDSGGKGSPRRGGSRATGKRAHPQRGDGRAKAGSGGGARSRAPSRAPVKPTSSSRTADDIALPGGVIREIRMQVRGRRADEAIEALDGAVVFLEKGVPAKAIREGEVAKKLAPRSGAVREILGLAYYQAERYREAVAEVQTYRRLTGRQDQNHIAADSYRALGQADKAVSLATDELRSKAPAAARAEAAVVGASALADQERYEEALALIRRFRTDPDEARPFDLRVWYVMADIYEQAGRTREAIEMFRRVFRHDAAAFDVAERLAQLED